MCAEYCTREKGGGKQPEEHSEPNRDETCDCGKYLDPRNGEALKGFNGKTPSDTEEEAA